jgi:hypothetical protein
MNLQPTEIVIVFIKPSQNKYLTQFVDVYQTTNFDKVKCLVLTGSEGANNRTAENKVKQTYNAMRKVGDNRKLIIFSAGIGSRSFSVGKIYREINLSDSELTSATIQEFARAYTYEVGKQVADIIRIGFSPMELAEQLYLAENDLPSYDNNSNERIRMFLMNNSFSNVLISENGNIPKYQTLGNQSDDIGKFLDSVCKFSDSTSYIMTRISSEGLAIDTNAGNNVAKATTKAVSTSIRTKIKNTKSHTGKVKITAEDEKRLRQYINICRCIPSISNVCGIKTIDGFLKSGYWKQYLEIDQKLFEENYNNSQEFKGIICGLFRQSSSKTIETHNQRLEEYMKFIS